MKKRKHSAWNNSKKKRRGGSLHNHEDNDDFKASPHSCHIVAIAFAVIAFAGAAATAYNILKYGAMRADEIARSAMRREPRARTTWSTQNARFDDDIFYRCFRMPRVLFVYLCNRIESVVGEKEFKSESYLNRLKDMGHSTRESSIYNASRKKNGDWIPGEMKVAITLRLLGGASYLDMYLWLDIKPNHVKHIQRHVTKYWLCRDEVMSINFYRDVLNNRRAIKNITEHFSEKSEGVLGGCIGALDGWLVKIHCPNDLESKNAGRYFSRKGFYAINVQAIVDRKKRILWRYIGSKGSSHDSPCFHESKLGQHLAEISDDLFRKGLYLIGDSAYALRGYLLTPYDNVQFPSKQDSFNYYLSKNRIYVECAFGEIDRRWGIFWKPLEGNLFDHQYTIDAAMKLHNLIVYYREKNNLNTRENNRRDRSILNEACADFSLSNPFENLGVFLTEYEARRRRGRPTTTARKNVDRFENVD